MSSPKLLKVARSFVRKLLLSSLTRAVRCVKNSPKLKRFALFFLLRFPVMNIKLRKMYSAERNGYNLDDPGFSAEEGRGFCVQKKLGVNSGQMTPLEKFFQNYGGDE